MTNRCPKCDADVPLTARSCPACGTANPARRAILGTAIVLAVLGPAVAIGIYAATRWDKPLIAGMGQQPSTATGDDFGWLSASMKACDEEAASQPNALHFLVTPLASEVKDLEKWRSVSLNLIGNALVLPGDDTIKGLRGKSLSVDPGEYTFSVQDEKTQATRRWENISGVKWLSITNAEDVDAIRMQFKPRGKGNDARWGNVIPRHKGNCYWINAVFDG